MAYGYSKPTKVIRNTTDMKTSKPAKKGKKC